MEGRNFSTKMEVKKKTPSPETNPFLAPEKNGWLEDDAFLFGSFRPIFSGFLLLVSCRDWIQACWQWAEGVITPFLEGSSHGNVSQKHTHPATQRKRCLSKLCRSMYTKHVKSSVVQLLPASAISI